MSKLRSEDASTMDVESDLYVSKLTPWESIGLSESLSFYLTRYNEETK